MSNLGQAFITAPRIKIYVDGIPVAFAVGMSINVSVDVQDINVVGSYAPIAQEPTMYNPTNGSMQIVRVLSRNTQLALNSIANGQSQLTSQDATRPTTDFNALQNSGQVVAASGTNNSILQNELARHLSPERVLLSKSFDIEMFLKVPDINPDGTPNITAANPYGLKEVSWMKIKDCRIVSDSQNIAMGSLTNSPVSFQGLLLTPTVTGVNQFRLDGVNRQNVISGL